MDLPIDVKKKKRDKFTIDLLLYIILFVVCSGMKSHRGSESRRGSRRMEPRTKKMKIMMMMLWRPKKRVMLRRIVSRTVCHKESCGRKAFTPCLTCNRWLCPKHAILAAMVHSGSALVGDFVYGCVTFHVPESFAEMEALIRKNWKGFFYFIYNIICNSRGRY